MVMNVLSQLISLCNLASYSSLLVSYSVIWSFCEALEYVLIANVFFDLVFAYYELQICCIDCSDCYWRTALQSYAVLIVVQMLSGCFSFIVIGCLVTVEHHLTYGLVCANITLLSMPHLFLLPFWITKPTTFQTSISLCFALKYFFRYVIFI